MSVEWTMTIRDLANHLRISRDLARHIMPEITGDPHRTHFSPAEMATYMEAQAHEPKERGCVYFVQAVSGGLIKIGIASNLAARLKSLQSMCPLELRVLAVARGEYRDTELALHKHFADLRRHGEWFEPDPDLLDFIEQIKKLPQ